MWRGKPNHCFLVAIATGGVSETYMVIARDEADAEALMSRRYSAKPQEKIHACTAWPDEVAQKCGISLQQHGAFAALDLVWVKSG
jgi:hypothetical protein